MTLKELREKRAVSLKTAGAVRDVATAAKRDLTAEELTAIKGHCDAAEATAAEIATAEASANMLEGLARNEAALTQTTGRISDSDASDPVTDRQMTVPANVKRFGKLRHLKNDLQAYRFGHFMRAIFGRASSLKFCAENGIPLGVEQENVNTSGGYLVPTEFDNALIDLRETYGIARQCCGMKPMTRDTLQIPRRTGGLTAYFVGETGAGTASTKAWDNVVLVAKKLIALSLYTSELAEDAIINIGDDLAGEIAYAFANKEDDCWVNGDGTSTYGGIVGMIKSFQNLSATRANIAGYVVSTGNLWSELVLGDFNKVIGRLPQFADSPNAKWIAHKTFYEEVMQKLAVAAGGVTLTEAIGGNRSQRMFLGYPVVFSQVMPKVEANDHVPVFFGDCAKACAFGDRRQTTLATSESATVGSVNSFASDQLAIRGTERFDINVHDVGNAHATAASRVPGPIVCLATAAS